MANKVLYQVGTYSPGHNTIIIIRSAMSITCCVRAISMTIILVVESLLANKDKKCDIALSRLHIAKLNFTPSKSERYHSMLCLEPSNTTIHLRSDDRPTDHR